MKTHASSPGSALMSGKTFSATSYSSWPASGFIPSIFATLVLPAIGVGARVGPHGARRAPTAYEEDRILHPGWARRNLRAAQSVARNTVRGEVARGGRDRGACDRGQRPRAGGPWRLRRTGGARPPRRRGGRGPARRRPPP